MLLMKLTEKIRPSSRVKTNSGGQVKKRRRTIYSKKEVQILKRHFRKNPYLNEKTRYYLCELLGYTVERLKIWYQNHRMRWMKRCGDSDSEATDKDDISRSENLTRRQIIDIIRSRRRNKTRGTCCGNSMDIQMNSRDSASYNDKDLPNVTNVAISPPRLDAFRPPKPNSSVFHTSLQIPSMIQDRTVTDQQPAHNSHSYTIMDRSNVANVGIHPPWMDVYCLPQPNSRGFKGYALVPSMIQDSAPAPRPPPVLLQHHYSQYVNSPYFATPPLANSDQRYGYNMHQNQEVSNASAYNSQMEVESTRCANEFNSVNHTTVSSSQNLEYQASYNHLNYYNNGAMRSNQRVNSPSHPVYERENSRMHKIRTYFNRSLAFRNNETSGSSQHTNHSVPNNFNLHRNLPAPGITANTSSITFPAHPSTFNQASFNSCRVDGSGISSYQEPSGSYMNCLSPNPSTEFSEDDRDLNINPILKNDSPSWDQTFSEPLRNLLDTADIVCSAQPTYSTSSQSFS